MDYIFDDWKKVLEDFQKSVSKDLQEIHRQKDEVQQMKNDIFNRLDSGKYVRSDSRLILSAPEVIIGNVDKSGDLMGSGRVVLRASDIDLDGVGEHGAITSRATSIRQTAVDPGIDGLEAVVYPHSSIVSQARSLTLQSDDATDAFVSAAPMAAASGIYIHADRQLDISASQTSTDRKKAMEDRAKAMKDRQQQLKDTADKQMKDISSFMKQLKDLMDQQEKLSGDIAEVRANTIDIVSYQQNISSMLPALYRSMVDFIHTVSLQAEAARQAATFDKQKDKVQTGDAFTKKTTGASLSLTGEQISILSHDGDGTLRTNPEAGVSIHTKRMGISMSNPDGTLVDGSSFALTSERVAIVTSKPTQDGKEIKAGGQVRIASQDVCIEAMDYENREKKYLEKGLAADGHVSISAKRIEVSTATPAGISRDDKGKLTKGEYKSEGDIVVRSKTLAVEGFDYEVKDGKLTPKTLTKDSAVTVRAEKMGLLAVDTEGKATGSIAVNAKAVSVKSMDVDKEKLDDKSLADGGTMLLVSQKMFVGAKSKSIKSKLLQGVSEEVGVFADKTYEAQQGDGKAVVQLSDGNANVKGSKTQLYGKTTINADTEVKGEVKAPKGTFDNLEAKTSFKSPNISDGMGVGAPGAGGSLSTKLKAEDAQ